MTVRDMTRAEVLERIGSLHDRCRECEQRKEMERTVGKLGQYAKIDRHCNKSCPIGARLQELGKHLGRGAKPESTSGRKRRREWMLEEREETSG